MKNLSLIILFLTLPILFVAQSNEQHIYGTLVNAQTGEPIPDIQVGYYERYSLLQSAPTDSSGNFRFTVSLYNNRLIIKVHHHDYVEKIIHLSELSTSGDIQIQIQLRPRETAFEINDIEESIIGMRVKRVMKQFDLDVSDLDDIHEPAGKCRGFRFELGDGTIVSIFTSTTMARPYRITKAMLRKKITGFTVVLVNGERRTLGYGKPLMY